MNTSGPERFGGVIFCGCGGLTGDGHFRKNRNHHSFGLYFGDCFINHENSWKFNIAPENGWLEDEFPFGMAYF